MEKKNTMLLTVIAVATLLVAVVGATFAYFSLTAEEESSTTGTITTSKIGLATINAVNTNLTLNLTPQDMSAANKNQMFYATGNDETTGQPEQKSDPIPLVKASLKDAEEGATYECNLTVTVSSARGDDMLGSLEEGWATLTLSGTAAGEDPQPFDLSELKNSEDKVYNGSFTLTPSGAGAAEGDVLSAVLSFKNTDEEETLNVGKQNVVAGKTLKIDITTTGGKCEIVKAQD